MHPKGTYLEIFSTIAKDERTARLSEMASFVKEGRGYTEVNLEEVRRAHTVCSEHQFIANYVQGAL